MASFEYIVPISYVSEDNETIINKAYVFIKNCNIYKNFPILINDECASFNFNRCTNDDQYEQPFIIGDNIYIQYPIDPNLYFFFALEFIDVETGGAFPCGNPPPIEYILDFKFDEDLTLYFNLVIDTNNECFEQVDCWYFRLKLYKCDLLDNPDFIECFSNKIEYGASELEAVSECYEELCDSFDYIITEPYRKVKCNEKTLLITGAYNEKDCDLFFYSNTEHTGLNAYRLSFRVYGVVEPDGFEITETLNNKTKVKSEQKERFILLTEKIPYYVAQQIQRAFNSQQLTIDGVNYSGAISLNKNFDEGSMWIIKENIFINCDEIDFGCST